MVIIAHTIWEGHVSRVKNVNMKVTGFPFESCVCKVMVNYMAPGLFLLTSFTYATPFIVPICALQVCVSNRWASIVHFIFFFTHVFTFTSQLNYFKPSPVLFTAMITSFDFDTRTL